MGLLKSVFRRWSRQQDSTSAYGISDVGSERDHNEDSILVAAERGVYVVADGMGGHNAGDVASTEVIKVIDKHLSRILIDQLGDDVEHLISELMSAVHKAHTHLVKMAENNPSLRGMGSTAVAGLVCGNQLLVAHIGDARAYRARESTLSILTRDHSSVMDLVAAGELTLEEARHNPLKCEVTQALGASQVIDPGFGQHTLEEGDRVLLCSDGLWEMLSHDEIEEMVCRSESPKQICSELVAAANSAGGNDNISVIVIDY